MSKRMREVMRPGRPDDAELIDPTGRWQGIDGQSSTPTTVTSWRASTSPSEPTTVAYSGS